MLVKLMLEIPSDVYHKYVEQAGKEELEDILADRLKSCVSHTSTKPLYIDDATRQQFEKLLGRNFSTPTALLEAVKKALTIKLSGVDVQLPPQLLTRLKTRCFGKPFPDFLKDQVVHELEEYTMMG